jgi:hypothetical protein
MFAAGRGSAGQAGALMPVRGGCSGCWWRAALVSCLVLVWFWFSGVQHDEGDGGGGKQRRKVVDLALCCLGRQDLTT